MGSDTILLIPPHQAALPHQEGARYFWPALINRLKIILVIWITIWIIIIIILIILMIILINILMNILPCCLVSDGHHFEACCNQGLSMPDSDAMHQNPWCACVFRNKICLFPLSQTLGTTWRQGLLLTGGRSSPPHVNGMERPCLLRACFNSITISNVKHELPLSSRDMRTRACKPARSLLWTLTQQEVTYPRVEGVDLPPSQRYNRFRQCIRGRPLLLSDVVIGDVRLV